MAGERALPGLGLVAFRTPGDDGWDIEFNANMLLLSALVQLGVISRTTNLPGSPANGDVYIVPAGQTNAHAVAVRDNGAWVYFTPKSGWRAYVRDSEEFAVFDGAVWESEPDAAGVPEAPQDGKIYGRIDGTWAEIMAGGGGVVLPPIEGQAGKILAVNAAADGFEWITPPTGGGGGDPYPGDELPPIADQNGKVLAVKADGSGVEWIDPPAGGGGGAPTVYSPAVPIFGAHPTWLVYFEEAQVANTSVKLAEVDFLDRAGNVIDKTGAVATTSIGGTAANAIDNDPGTVWSSSFFQNPSAHIQVVFPAPVEVVGFRIRWSATASANNHPKVMSLRYSDETSASVNAASVVSVSRYENVTGWTTGGVPRDFMPPEAPRPLAVKPNDGLQYVLKGDRFVPIELPEIPDLVPPEVATYASVWRIEFTANQGNTTGLRIAKLELLDENGVDRITEAWLTASPYSGSDGMVSGVSDASLGTFYMSSANPTDAAPIFIEARFKEPVGISTVRMTAENTTNTTRLSYHPKSFRILADGQLDQTVTDLPAWTAALARSYTIGTEPGSFVSEAPPTGGPHVRDGSTGAWVPLAAPAEVETGAYKIWRLLVLETDSTNIGFGEIEFRDAPGGTNLVGTGVARNGFGASSTTMASWFDKNTATDTYSAGGSVAANKWVEYEFLSPVEVGEVAIAGAAGNSTFQSSNVISYEVYGSNDGVNYDFLASRYNMARWPLSTVETRTLAIPATRTVAGSVLSDAPKDGKLYGRRDGEWEEASGGGGAAEIPEPPNDGLNYTRRGDGTWQPLVTDGNFPVGNAPYGGALIVPAGPQSYSVIGAWAETRYQTEVLDTDGFWDVAAPNRYTIPAGITKVRLVAAVRSTTAIGDNVFEFAKNGVRDFPGGAAASIPEGGYATAGTTLVSGVISVVAGDYFTLDYFVAGSFTGSVDSFFALEVVERVDGSNTAINTPLRNLLDVDADAPTDGDSLVWDETAGKWVSRPATNIAAGVNRPFKGAMARFNAAKTYPSFPITVEWDGVDYDTDGFWSAASPVRLTVPPGVSKVRLTAELLPEVSWSTSNTSFLLSIRKNGARARGLNEESRGTGDYTDAGISLVTGVLAVSPGDYFEVRFNSATAGNGALHTLCSFSIEAVETTEIA